MDNKIILSTRSATGTRYIMINQEWITREHKTPQDSTRLHSPGRLVGAKPWTDSASALDGKKLLTSSICDPEKIPWVAPVCHQIRTTIVTGWFPFQYQGLTKNHKNHREAQPKSRDDPPVPHLPWQHGLYHRGQGKQHLFVPSPGGSGNVKW